MQESQPHGLQPLGAAYDTPFETPAKKINETEDVNFFLTSKAYTDIVKFILQLNATLFPRKQQGRSVSPAIWQLDSEDVKPTHATEQLATLLSSLGDYIEQAPPEKGPRRFGNAAFRKWYGLAKTHLDELMDAHLPALKVDPNLGARVELKAYLLGAFGSAQRLDYGTGHELSFLAFLGGLWKLGAFDNGDAQSTEAQERAIALHVFQSYLELVRRLILTYTLEPAGTHGVWGLDDHSFLPYVFGSAQLGPPISSAADIPQEGSLRDAPDPGDVVKAAAVERERKQNMYFSAIGFIYDVKKGPFWEHSPMLYDISGIRAGWAKINKGMIKMYIAEVLSKFPVVQHFPFGKLFAWEHDPNAPPPVTTPHTSAAQHASRSGSSAPVGTRMPSSTAGPTAAPMPSTRTPPASNSSTGAAAPSGMPSTRAPWAKAPSAGDSSSNGAMAPTKAPWAR